MCARLSTTTAVAHAHTRRANTRFAACSVPRKLDLRRVVKAFRAKGVLAPCGSAGELADAAAELPVLDLQAAPAAHSLLPPGFSFIPGALTRPQQLALAKSCVEEWSFKSDYNNLLANAPDAPVTSSDLHRIRWSTLGYHYDWTNRAYRPGWRSEFPKDLAALCVDLASNVGVPRGTYEPTAAIVNFYAASATPKNSPMGPHRDDAELTMDKPIVSISLGCSAVFCIESNPPPSAAPSHVVAMWLRSGDVCIMDGASRNALHAVACVVPDPPRGSAPEEGVLGAYLASHRININTRQVEGDFGHETFAGQALRVKRVKENAGGLLEAACSEV